MMKKLLLSATLLLAASQFLSRTLGVVRDHVFAQMFGATGGVGITNIDTYYAAFRLPDLVYNLLIFGTLSAAFVPLLMEQKNKEAVNRFASNTLNVLLVGMLVFAAVMWVIAAPLTHLLTPGFSAAEVTQTASLLRIQLLAPIFLTISAIFGGLAQHYHRFVWYSLAPIAYNLGIIGGALFLGKEYGVYGVSVGVAVGAGLHALVQLPGVLKGGWRYRFAFRPSELLEFFRLAGPRVISVAASQLELVLITVFASLVGTGALAVFNYAFNLASLPFGIIGVAYATAGFATLARLAKQPAAFAVTLGENLKGILFWAIPAAVGLFLLRSEVTTLVLAGGAFTDTDIDVVAESLGVLTLAVPFLAVLPTMNNAFFARKDTHTPLIAGVIYLAVTGFGAWWAIERYEATGLALAFAAASIAGVSWLGARLTDDVPLAIGGAIGRIILAITPLIVIVGAGAYLIDATSWLGIAGKIIALAALGGAAYLATAKWLGLDPRHFATVIADETNK